MILHIQVQRKRNCYVPYFLKVSLSVLGREPSHWGRCGLAVVPLSWGDRIHHSPRVIITFQSVTERLKNRYIF